MAHAGIKAQPYNNHSQSAASRVGNAIRNASPKGGNYEIQNYHRGSFDANCRNRENLVLL